MKIGRCRQCGETGAVDPQLLVHNCDKCEVSTCLTCNKTAHNGPCQEPSLLDQAVAAATETTNYACRCGLQFARGSGCAKLKCPNCGMGFCANCRETFEMKKDELVHDVTNPHFCMRPLCGHVDCGNCPHVPSPGYLSARATSAFIVFLKDNGIPQDAVDEHAYAQFGRGKTQDGYAYALGVLSAPAGATAPILAGHAAQFIADRDRVAGEDDESDDDASEGGYSEGGNDSDSDDDDEESSPESVIDLVSDDDSEPELPPIIHVVVTTMASALESACDREIAAETPFATLARVLERALRQCPLGAQERLMVDATHLISQQLRLPAADPDDEVIDRTRGRLLAAFEDPSPDSVQICTDLSATLCRLVSARAVRLALADTRAAVFSNPSAASSAAAASADPVQLDQLLAVYRVGGLVSWRSRAEPLLAEVFYSF